MKKLIIGGLLMVASFGFAEETVDSLQGETVTEAPAQQPGTEGIFGGVDLRPSYDGDVRSYRSENNLFLGYQFNPTTRLGLVTDINTNFDDRGRTFAEPINLYSKLNVNDIATIPGTSLSLSYENRTYAPVEFGKRESGHILSMRNYFKLTQQVSESVKVSLYETPIFHVYNRPVGTRGPNPWFENRVYLVGDVQLGPVSIIPALWYAKSAFREPTLTDNYVEFDLDVTYAVDPNVSVGLGFYSTNLLTGNSRVDVARGIKTGVSSIILQANL